MFIYKDSRGYLWVSSQSKGAFRYDGLQYKQYPSDDTLDLNIQSDFYEDGEGNIWFSSVRFLYKYVRKKDAVEDFSIMDRLGNQMQGLRVFYLDKKRNELWIKAEDKIAVLNCRNPSETRFIPGITKGMSFTVDTSFDGTVEKIYACPWLMPETKGIEIWEKKSEWTKRENVFSTDLKSGTELRVSQVILGRDFTIWLLTTNGIWYALDGTAPRKIGFKNKPIIRCVKGIVKNQNYLQVASTNEGVVTVDMKKRIAVDNLQTTARVSGGTQSKVAVGVYLDNEENEWITHQGKGLKKSEFPAQPFYNPLGNYGLSNVSVNYIVEDASGDVWVSTVANGLFRFSFDGKLIESFSYGNSKKNSIPISELQHLSIGKNGEIWCMSRNSIFNFKNGNWHKVLKSNYPIFYMLHHSSGRILVSTSAGVMDLARENGTVQLKESKEFKNRKDFGFLNTFEVPYTHEVIFYGSNQLWKYGCFGDSLVLKGSANFDAEIYTISESNHVGCLSLGTSNGLMFLDSNLSIGQIYKAPLPIGRQNLFGILEDEMQRVWAATSKGLWCYPNKNILDSCFLYRKEDGLPGEEFNQYAFLKSRIDGKFWFGSKKGILVFRPSEINPYPFAPSPHIEELRVHDMPYISEDGTQIDEKDELSFSYKDNNLSFKLVAVGFHFPNLSTLHWKLDGYYDEWQSIENGGYANFRKLPPGRYTLQVAAANLNNLGNPNIKTFEIEIRRPLWQRWWFILLVLTTILASGYSLYRWRLEQLLRVERIRNQISSDLHDDIGATLSVVKILNKLVQQKIPPNSETMPLLVRINEEISSSAESLDDIIWSINPKHDKLGQILARMRRFASEVFEGKAIEGIIKFPQNIDDLRLDMGRRRQFYLLFKEAINNLAKYSGCKKAEFEVSYQNGNLNMRIADDGAGFDLGSKLGTGNGLTTMKERAANLKGTINISSNPGKGTSVSVTFPVTETRD
ncbi:MAG: hypothetical protein GC192_21350 [Bacteroidetes bacterium]|nr:hypothetical protein [Bacteroidota bacterium]